MCYNFVYEVFNMIIYANKINNDRLYFLKMNISGHPLLEEGLEFSLVNDARITPNTSERLTHLIGNLWINNLITIVGKNATGKTTIMKLMIGLMQNIVAGNSITQSELNDVLIGKNPIKVDVYFYGTKGYIYKDSLTYSLNINSHQWYIEDEKIYQKKITPSMSKTKMFDFTKAKVVLDRKELDTVAASILSPDDSVFKSIISKEDYYVQAPVNTLFYTNFNALTYIQENVPTEILTFLDPSIEYLKIDFRKDDTEKDIYRLKFKNSDTEIVENSFTNITKYLSSGTAKGISLYGLIMLTLESGGIIFIDEIEDHFNHTIVDAFIEYFTDKAINVNHATLVFSTHYSEILDQIDRTDEEYITRRDKKISLQRYSQTHVRSDLSKAEVFESDYLGGTAPEYDAYIALKKATTRWVAKNNK